MRLIVGTLSFIIFSFLSTVIFKIIDPVSFRYLGDLPFFLIFLSYSVLVLSPVIITNFYIRKKYLVYYSLVMANVLLTCFFIFCKVKNISGGQTFLNNLIISFLIWLCTGLISIILDKKVVKNKV